MLERHEISISCLLVWTGIALGIVLLGAGEFTSVDLDQWGLGLLGVTCTYSIHRSLAARDERLRQAFEMGQDHARSCLTSVR